jgi:hypothetical protein
MKSSLYPDLFAQLVGEQLSSVTFVQDYLQIHFDGPSMNVNNPLTVESDGQKITSWEPGFRDLLCSLISQIVRHTECIGGERLTVLFENGSRISVSLRQEDYSSPEAIYVQGFKDNRWFVL